MTSPVVTQDEAAIRRLLAEAAANLRAGDAAKLIARLAPDVVQYSLAPPLSYVGPAARDEDKLRQWFAGFAGPVDYEMPEPQVAVAGDVAFAFGLARMTATPRGSTEPFTLWLRKTVCLRKVDGRWLVVNEHDSVPFHMDGSFAAAVELTP